MLFKPDLSLEFCRHREVADRFCNLYRVNQGGDELPLLRAILKSFSHFPYENLSKIIKLHRSGPHIRLPVEVLEDHLRMGLGGTCFSLTFLLQTILDRYGFSSYPVMADMRAGRNSHCCLVVKIGQRKYLLDPSYLLHLPLELDPVQSQVFDVGHSSVELQFAPQTQCYNLFTLNRKERKWRYRFRDIPTPLADFLGYWRSSFDWKGMWGICLIRSTGEGLYYLHNDFMRRTTQQGRINYGLRGEDSVVEEIFGLKREVVEEAREALRMRRELSYGRARTG